MANRIRGAAKFVLGAVLIGTGFGSFPVTQAIGGAMLAIGLLVKNKTIGGILKRTGDALLTAPVSGAWLAGEGFLSAAFGKNIRMGIQTQDANGRSKICGVGHICTKILPHMVNSVAASVGLAKKSPDAFIFSTGGNHAQQQVSHEYTSVRGDDTRSPLRGQDGRNYTPDYIPGQQTGQQTQVHK